MKYRVRINKRIKYVRVYTVLKRVKDNSNAITKFFLKLFAPKKEELS